MIHVLKCLFKETTELLDEYHKEDLTSPQSYIRPKSLQMYNWESACKTLRTISMQQ